MKILALEFSSPQRSVAVLNTGLVTDELSESPALQIPPWKRAERCGRSVLALREVVETGSGATRAFSLVEEALREAAIDRREIDCLAIGIGPGSYTGIRNAIALAQGWQLANGVKLLGVNSVEALAAQAQAEGVLGTVDIVVDAQRNEFYLARYEIVKNRVHEIAPLALVPLDALRECESAGEMLVGPEVNRWFSGGRTLFPRAATVAQLALGRRDFLAGENLEPIYLRPAQFVKAPPPRVLPPSGRIRTTPSR